MGGIHPLLLAAMPKTKHSNIKVSAHTCMLNSPPVRCSLQSDHSSFLGSIPIISSLSIARLHPPPFSLFFSPPLPVGAQQGRLPPALPSLWSQNEAALADFAMRLRNFRPSATVLEAEIAQVKSTFTNPLLDADSLRSKSNEVRVWGLYGGEAGMERLHRDEGGGTCYQSCESELPGSASCPDYPPLPQRLPPL